MKAKVFPEYLTAGGISRPHMAEKRKEKYSGAADTLPSGTGAIFLTFQGGD
jgi:hypothetical protein